MQETVRKVAVRQGHAIVDTPKGCTKRIAGPGVTTTRSRIGFKHDHRFINGLRNRRCVQKLVKYAPARVSTIVCEEVDEFILVVVGRTAPTVDGETIVGRVAAERRRGEFLVVAVVEILTFQH